MDGNNESDKASDLVFADDVNPEPEPEPTPEPEPVVELEPAPEPVMGDVAEARRRHRELRGQRVHGEHHMNHKSRTK